MSSTNIEELLNGTDETDVVEAPSATEEHDAENAQDSQESVQEPVKQDKTVPLKALEEERRKRQDFERHLMDLQRQNAELVGYLKSQHKQESNVSAPDFLTENEKWQAHLFNAIGSILDQREEQAWAKKTEAYEEDMRESHDDYDELVDNYFKPAASRDPSLLQKLRGAANPAKYAYRMAKKLQTESELGQDMDLGKLKSKLEEEIRAKVMAELGISSGQKTGKARIPESLGGVGSSGAPSSGDRLVRPRDFYS